MCSLNDGCYKQLKKCKLCPTKPKKRMTGQFAVLGAIVVFSVSFRLKAEKIIIITSYSYR